MSLFDGMYHNNNDYDYSYSYSYIKSNDNGRDAFASVPSLGLLEALHWLAGAGLVAGTRHDSCLFVSLHGKYDIIQQYLIERLFM